MLGRGQKLRPEKTLNLNRAKLAIKHNLDYSPRIEIWKYFCLPFFPSLKPSFLHSRASKLWCHVWEVVGQVARGLARRVGLYPLGWDICILTQYPKWHTTHSRLLSLLLIPPFAVAQEGFFCPNTLLNYAATIWICSISPAKLLGPEGRLVLGAWSWEVCGGGTGLFPTPGLWVRFGFSGEENGSRSQRRCFFTRNSDTKGHKQHCFGVQVKNAIQGVPKHC